jgi:hypothetical protein
MTTFLERVDYEDVTARAREVSFIETVARLFAVTLFVMGWAVAKMFTVVWFAAVWTALAFAEGWSAARADTKTLREMKAARNTGG